MRQIRWTGLLAGLMIGLLFWTGCGEPKAGRLNAPPQGVDVSRNPLQDNYVAMYDNAVLADSSMSPAHFVPRTSKLNGLGARRLNRLAEIMKTYGGTVFYDGNEKNTMLREDRMDSIREYLTEHGVDEGEFTVEAGLPGGRGMHAEEAIAARKILTRSQAQGGSR